MTEAVVATYNDEAAIGNVRDDLRAIGIPLEQIRVDTDRRKIRVMTPEETKAEVMEILNRHKPAEIH